jgi:hypothetical protein
LGLANGGHEVYRRKTNDIMRQFAQTPDPRAVAPRRLFIAASGLKES